MPVKFKYSANRKKVAVNSVSEPVYKQQTGDIIIL